MNGITVFATGDVEEGVVKQFATDVGPELEVHLDPRKAFFKSLEPPSWVHVLQSPEFWISAFAGSAVWDLVKHGIRDHRKLAAVVDQAATNSLMRFARALSALGKRLGEGTQVWLGCPVPNDWFATVMLVRTESPDQLEADLSLFVSHLPALERFYEAQAGNLTGQVTLRLCDDGSMSVTWMDLATLTPQESHFERPDTA